MSRRRTSWSVGGWMGLGIWIVTVGLVILYLGYFGLLRRMGQHWLPMSLIAVVGLMISGPLGPGLGLPMLFRDDPDRPRQFFSRSFFGGLGATLLTITVWSVVYYGDFLEAGNYQLLQRYQAQHDQWKASGGCLPFVVRPWEGIVLYESNEDFRSFVPCATLPILLLIALCVVYPTPSESRRLRLSP